MKGWKEGGKSELEGLLDSEKDPPSMIVHEKFWILVDILGRLDFSYRWVIWNQI